MEGVALLILALLACGGVNSLTSFFTPDKAPPKPPPPRLPAPPVLPPDPPITDLLEPQSGTPEWPQVVPRGVPTFPGPGWEFYDPPPAHVVRRARALVSTLWARGQGSWRIERTLGVWAAYRAEIVASGKKGVVVYRIKAAAQKPEVEIQRTSTPAPAMPTLKYGDGQKPAAPIRAVALVQEELGVKPVNGRFGPLTRNAVIAYQRAQGLTPDGIVGPQTWARLLHTTA